MELLCPVNRARIVDEHPDFDPGNATSNTLVQILAGEVGHNHPRFHPKLGLKFAGHLFEQRLSTRQQHKVDPRRRELPGEALPNAIRGPGHQRPGAESRAKSVRVISC